MIPLLCFFLTIVSGQDGAGSVQEQAISLIQKGRANEAARLLALQAERTPKDVNIWNLLGIADGEAGNLKDAKNAFEHGLALAPKSPELNENVGLLFFRQHDYVDAKRYLSAAVTLGSDKTAVRFSLAEAMLRTGEAREALAALRALEPALSGMSEYWSERGRAELLNSPKEASDCFERALALTPDDVAVLNDAATAAEREGLDEKALSYLIRARALAPNDILTLTHFGSVCIRRDLGPDARDALHKAHELQPQNNTALYLLARANISVENWQESYDLFEELSNRLPNYAPAFYAMGWLDARMNRLADARRKLEHALSLQPRLSGAAYELAQLDFDDGNMDAAERRLRAVLKEDQNNAKAKVTLGQILMQRGMLDAAQSLFESAVQTDASMAAAHYQLSVLLFRKHDTQRAAKEREIAADLNENLKRAGKTQLRLVLPDSDNVH